MIYTTLNRIRKHSPCENGWKKLLSHLGKTKADNKPLAITVILDNNGVDDALWCLRAEPQHSNIWRLLAVHYARQAQCLMKDPRSLNALDTAERHAYGLAKDSELAAARAAAWAASKAAEKAASKAAARAAAWAASGITVEAAIWAGALASAHAAAWVNEGDASETASFVTALNACRKKQADDLRTVLEHYDANPGCEIHGWKREK